MRYFYYIILPLLLLRVNGSAYNYILKICCKKLIKKIIKKWQKKSQFGESMPETVQMVNIAK